MKFNTAYLITSSLRLSVSLSLFLIAPAFASRTTLSFDPDWRFLRGDPANAQAGDFDDSAWRTLDVPHDWSIEGPFDEKNTTGQAGAYLPSGVGWYRKHFTLPADDAARKVFIDFDGVMANSDVWINGFNLGHRPYGYVSFRYELSGHLNFGDGKDNVLAVRMDTSAEPASRWYTGAGIYRHVRLVVTEPVHLDHWATYITTPKISADQAIVHVHTTVVNQSNDARSFSIGVVIPENETNMRMGGETVQVLQPGKSVDCDLDVPISKPRIWDIDHPEMYSASVGLNSGSVVLDEETLTFGIRSFEFKPDTGFWLNGRNFKLKGVCLHHDGGAVGAAVPLSVWERRLSLLKSVGANAIRTAHNPPSPEFLDLCDRMGFLVMDEMFDCWTVGKNKDDYHLYFKDWWQPDVTNTILRDRNHPSIILYSAGNEIRDINPRNDLGARVFTGIRDVMHQIDPTRPVTMAVLRPNQNNVYTNGFAELMDVVGQNYRENELVAAHAAKPAIKIIGTENHHDLDTWTYLRDTPAYAGQFLWTGVDYLGESHGWPRVASSSGLFDRTGTIKPSGMQRQSWWTTEPMVAIARIGPVIRLTDPVDPTNVRRVPQNFADWSPEQRTEHVEPVEVYSNCDRVDLLLNGKSLGAQDRPSDNRDAPRTWKVTFAPGTLKAVAYNAGQVVATEELRTAGTATHIVLSTDRNAIPADWDDVAYVQASVVDDAGVTVPNYKDTISFNVSGNGVLAAVDSGDVTTHDPFQGTQHHAYRGTCFALVRGNGPGGTITVSATADGLAAGSISIATLEARKQP